MSEARSSVLVRAAPCGNDLRPWAAAGGASASNAHTAHLNPLASVPLVGFVNALAFAKSGEFLLAGVGQEHRCGRWQRIAEARNGLHIVRLPH